MQNEQNMKVEKSDFAMIKGEVLTISIEASVGTHANFGTVLPVTFLAGVRLVARYHGVPKPTHAERC
jgi:hypothetical protein